MHQFVDRCAALAAISSLASVAALIAPTVVVAATPPEFRNEGGVAVNGQTLVAGAVEPIQRLAILPDRTMGRDWGLRYLRQAVADLNRLDPDAVFTVGDMVQGYTRDAAEWQRQADEYLGIVSALTMPLYPVAGNHDVLGGTRQPGDDAFFERYRRVFGPLWYAVEFERITVIALFSDELSAGATETQAMRISDAQLTWLDGALDAGKARGKPIILLMHRPLWRAAAVQWEERVQPRLERAGVTAVIAGHFHSMQRDNTVGGVQYHIVGTCGGAIDQHPLAGQLQHLSFLDVLADGSVRFYHAAVGMTLPDDFVIREDQDRVFTLRDRAGVFKWNGSFPDPLMAPTPILGEVELEFHNPLDVPVEVSLKQVREIPGPWFIEGAPFLSWTPVDNFNPATTELVGPFNIAALERHSVAPGDTTQIPVRLRATPVAEAVQPPPIEFTITLKDREGRAVPVKVPLRLPLDRTITLPAALPDAVPYPICIWRPSPFDTAEINATCRMALERGADGDSLLVEVRVADQKPSGFADDPRPIEARRDDPIADAVRVVITTRERTIDCLTEPFAGRVSEGCSADAPEPWSDRRGWTQRIRVPWPGGRFDPTHGATVNVGVADNDDTFHTQWRWLAPRDFPAKVRMQATPAP